MERRRILVVAAALVAVLGAVLVLLYVRGSDNRAKEQYAMAKVLVAIKPIKQGETFAQAVAGGKLDLTEVVSTDRAAGAVTSLSAIPDDDVAQAPIFTGEQILGEKFAAASAIDDATATPALEIPPGDVAISVSLTDPQRVAGFVQPGSSVTVFVTTSSTNGSNGVKMDPSSAARVLLPKVMVLGVGSTAPLSQQAASDTTTAPAETLPNTLLTLAVTQKQAEKILLATAGGNSNAYTLSLGLLNPQSKVAMDNVVGPSNLFDGE